MSTAAAGRFIHTRFGPRQVTDLLQTIFAAELVAPSRCLWIVSPWVSDIPVLENRANMFTTLVGDWERSQVRLAPLLARLLHLGTTVHVATRPDEHNRDFVNRLSTLSSGSEHRLYTHVTETLHEKGILGDGFYLSGSMNITYNGISFNQEVLHYVTDPATVASHRQLFTEWWGGMVG
jgi:phosphatidylserine/phosphatidylglycerophosphate/cardiolipin synthase-like enzyme